VVVVFEQVSDPTDKLVSVVVLRRLANKIKPKHCSDWQAVLAERLVRGKRRKLTTPPPPAQAGVLQWLDNPPPQQLKATVEQPNDKWQQPPPPPPGQQQQQMLPTLQMASMGSGGRIGGNGDGPAIETMPVSFVT
jgi:hypothetical protein